MVRNGERPSPLQPCNACLRVGPCSDGVCCIADTITSNTLGSTPTSLYDEQVGLTVTISRADSLACSLLCWTSQDLSQPDLIVYYPPRVPLQCGTDNVCGNAQYECVRLGVGQTYETQTFTSATVLRYPLSYLLPLSLTHEHIFTT